MQHLECPIKQQATTSPNKIALIDKEIQLTYFELNQLIEKACFFLKKQKAKKIASYSQNNIYLIILLFASFRTSTLLFILSFRLPISSLEKIAKQYQLSPIFTDKHLPAYLNPIEIKTITSLSKSYTDTQIDKEIPSTILFTSGSTNDPKAAVLSYSNQCKSAIKVASLLNLKPNDRYLLSLPLSHVAGIAILFRTFITGSCVILENKGISFYDNLIHNRITHISIVTTQLYRLMTNHNPKNLNLKCILLGGGPISLSLYKKALLFNLPIHLTYGLTELSSSVLITNKPTFANNQLYLGEPIFPEMLCLSPDNEILLKGPTLFKGYLDIHQNINLSLNKDGFFATNDLGEYLPTKGYAILRRKDSLFISGGENIYPEEIETALLSLNEILYAIVVPIKDKEFGKRPIAYILHQNKEFEEKKIQEALQDYLPRFKIPKKILNLNSLKTKMKYRKKDLIEIGQSSD